MVTIQNFLNYSSDSSPAMLDSSIYRKINVVVDDLLRIFAQLFQNSANSTLYVNYISGEIRLTSGILEIDSFKTFKGRYTVQNINIDFPEEPDDLESGRSTHSNIILIDHLTHELELFEPNGSSFYTYSPMVKFLRENTSYRILNFQAVHHLDNGPQLIIDLPICVSFSLLYVYLRFSQPEVSQEELVKNMSNLPRKDLIRLMSNFLWFEYQIAIIYSLFELNDLKYKTYTILIDLYTQWEQEDIVNCKLRCDIAQELVKIVRNTSNYQLAKNIVDSLVMNDLR